MTQITLRIEEKCLINNSMIDNQKMKKKIDFFNLNYDLKNEIINNSSRENCKKLLNIEYSENNNYKIIKIDKNNNSIRNNKSISNDEPQCKICYEKNEKKNKLINPCLCQGSMKYIHENCLKKWIEKAFAHDKNEATCEICKYNYNMKFFMQYKFSCEKTIKTLKGMSSIMIVSIIIIILVLLIVYTVLGR